MATRLWNLRDPNLPQEFSLIRKVFVGEPNDRRRNEGLHDYFQRKGIKCFCPKCRRQQEKDQNLQLISE